MPNESSTRTNARISKTRRFENGGLRHRLDLRLWRPRVALHHRGAEFGELRRLPWRAGVVWKNAAMLRREAEGYREVQVAERVHLAIEPIECVRPEAVRPRKTRAQMPDPQALEPANRIAQAVIFVVEPLADPDRRRVPREAIEGELRRAFLAQQAHVEVPIIGRPFGLLVPRRRLPGFRQVVKAVPVDARRAAREQSGGAIHAPSLDFLGAKRRHADFGDPDRQISDCADLVQL